MAEASPNDPTGSSSRKGVSGKLIVLIVFGGAFLMWLTVFLIGLRERRTHSGREGADVTTTAEQIRPLLRALPERWSKVTLVEGQGWVLYVPCYSANSEAVFRTAPDSAPGLACEYCDSLDAFKVRAVARDRADSTWYLKLEPEAGDLRILPVDDSLLKAFPEAPFQDRIMLWTRPRAGGRTDSMIFVPKSQESEFETLRAEDENPEGCGGDDDPD